MNKLLINTATEFKEVAHYNGEAWHVKSWQEQASDLDHLLPSIEQLDVKMADLSEIIVLQGPGSFTSLRLGVATANTIAQELDIVLKVLNTADYVQARIAEPVAYCLLKSGGKQVHVFKDGEYVEQVALADFIEQHKNEELTVAVDFTERLWKIWQESASQLKALAAQDWQPLEAAWSRIEAKLQTANWPVMPEYFKSPGIS